MNDKKFIEELGVFKAKITRAFERPAKNESKPACYIEFERIADGAISSMRLNNPLKPSDLYSISKFIRAVQGKVVKIEQLSGLDQTKLIERLDSMKGEVVNIYVKPFELDTGTFKKTLWNVEDVTNGRYDSGTSSPNDDSSGSSDIPF